MRSRTLVVLGWAVLLGAGTRARAADREAALAMVERAIKAQGGAEALAKAQTASRSGEGLLFRGNDTGVPFTTTAVMSLPDRLRLTAELQKRFKVVSVINGDKGWLVPPGRAANEMPRDMLQEMREEAYVAYLTTLVPLKKDSFTLTPLPDANVNGQPAAVVKVAHAGHEDAKLYFDKKTSHLVKIERRGKEDGAPVNKAYLYSDYKAFGGARLPAREILTVNGKKWSEATYDAYKFLSKVDDKEFDKP